jgi:hypothetical protein
MKQTIQSMLVAGLIALSATAAYAQRNFTGYVGAFNGTSLLNSSGNSSTSYTFQIGTFNYGNVATGTDWFSWNSGGVNSGFTQLATGSINGGALSLDSDGFLFNFNYTAGNNAAGNSPGQIYPLARVNSSGEAFLDTPLLPYLVLTSARTGGNHLIDTRQVLVGQFNSALLGFDPEAVATENFLGLENDPEFFTALVGGTSGSGPSTTLASASVPEPSSFTLLVAGCVALAALRRRRA